MAMQTMWKNRESSLCLSLSVYGENGEAMPFTLEIAFSIAICNLQFAIDTISKPENSYNMYGLYETYGEMWKFNRKFKWHSIETSLV